MTPPEPRRPTEEDLEAIALGGTVETDVMAWLAANDPDGTLLDQIRARLQSDPVDSEVTQQSDVDLSPRKPSLAEIHSLALGRRVDPAVELWMANQDDGSVQAEVERIREDEALIDEFAKVHRQNIPAGKSIRQTPTPPGYEVLREIDRGAQGAVYLARQIAAKRDVALKVLLQGNFATERQLMRFEREVEVIASLKHPAIVTLYDSGTTEDGSAYLAMEFINGLPLNAVDSKTVTAREKAERFLRICDAVGYAHQRGIIHRDLKPANILVDSDGGPHILDFGLAKALDSNTLTESQYEMTAAGEFMGTFAYASPEQVSGDPDRVDTRTDVYALGVILYEQILGERPYRVAGSIAQMVMAITDDPPVAPSSLDAAIDKDLETILLKALAKEVDRRYQSPASLAEDVQHWLRGEAIEARRDDAWYVTGKFLKRHWLPVSAVCLGVLVLASFAIYMTVLWERADHFNRTSDRMLVSATQLLGTFNPENPDEPMSARNIAEAMQRWSHIINDNLAEFPDLAARLNVGLAENFMSLSRYDEAAAALDAAQVAYQSRGLEDSAQMAAVLHSIGRLRWLQGAYQSALEVYTDAYDMRREWLGPHHEDTLLSMRHLAVLLQYQKRLAESDRLFNEAIDLHEQRLDEVTDPELRRQLQVGLADVLNSLASRYLYMRPELAIPLLERGIAMMTAGNDGQPDWRVAAMLSSAGLARMSLDDLDRAERDLKQAQAIKEYNASPRQVSNGQALLARLAMRQGRLEDAFELITLARAERISRLREDHRVVMDTDEIRAEILIQMGQLEAAQAVLGTLQSRGGGQEAATDSIALLRLQGLWALADGNNQIARTMLQKAWTQLEERGDAATSMGRAVARGLVDVFTALDRPDEAERFRIRAQPPAIQTEARKPLKTAGGVERRAE